jgi:hypothetical protein
MSVSLLIALLVGGLGAGVLFLIDACKKRHKVAAENRK